MSTVSLASRLALAEGPLELLGPLSADLELWCSCQGGVPGWCSWVLSATPAASSNSLLSVFMALISPTEHRERCHVTYEAFHLIERSIPLSRLICLKQLVSYPFKY